MLLHSVLVQESYQQSTERSQSSVSCESVLMHTFLIQFLKCNGSLLDPIKDARHVPLIRITNSSHMLSSWSLRRNVNRTEWLCV